MADYYIRITDEEPVDMTKGVRFRYTGDGEPTDFVIVDESSYETLVEQFDNFSNDFERAVNYNLDNILESKIITNAERSNVIVEDLTDQNSDSIGFEDLKQLLQNAVRNSTFSTVANSVNDLLSRVSSLESTRITLTQLSNVESNLRSLFNNYYNKSETDTKLGNKADKEHTHEWELVETVGNWDTSVCWLKVNKKARLCEYKMNCPFTSATAWKKYEWGSGTIGNIPKAYRPNSSRYGSARINGGIGVIWVTSDGKIGGQFSTGWTADNIKTVYGSIVWSY